MFPIFDLAGNVAGMYGRKINDNLRAGTPMHTYLPGPHRGVWNEEALVASKEIILCESIIDALTFWCAGFRNVTASYGVNGFTDDHRAAFQKHGDRASAGSPTTATTPARRRPRGSKKNCSRLGIGSHRVLFPHGMDANEYALQGSRRESSGRAAEQAQWLGKGKPPGAEKVAAESHRRAAWSKTDAN